jgi:DNA-binding transcriptional LysR family regulator
LVKGGVHARPRSILIYKHEIQLHITTPKGRILTNNGEAMRDAAVAGLGLAVLPLFIVAEDLRAGRLIHVLPRETPVPDAIYAVYPQRRHKLRRLSALVEHLRNALAGVPPWERDLSTR